MTVTAFVALIAAAWVQFFTTDNGAVAYYDPSTVTRSDDTVRVRLRVVPGGDSRVLEYRATEELNCGRRTRTTIELVAALPDGGEERLDPVADGEPIEPGSTAGAIYDIVCGRGSPAT